MRHAVRSPDDPSRLCCPRGMWIRSVSPCAPEYRNGPSHATTSGLSGPTRSTASARNQANPVLVNCPSPGSTSNNYSRTTARPYGPDPRRGRRLTPHRPMAHPVLTLSGQPIDTRTAVAWALWTLRPRAGPGRPGRVHRALALNPADPPTPSPPPENTVKNSIRTRHTGHVERSGAGNLSHLRGSNRAAQAEGIEDGRMDIAAAHRVTDAVDAELAVPVVNR